ncbi:unnamed protein product [Rhodiola kirilowii]
MAVPGHSESAAPTPKSPPKYPDLYGKRREAARLQMLDREILLLQEDLKFVEALQPASVHCKEVVDFVLVTADPLTPTNKKKDHSSVSGWKWLCKLPPCFNLSWLCCYHCSLCFQVPKSCRSCKPCDCTLPKCNGGCLCCFHKSACSTNCCDFECPSCSASFCTVFSCSAPKCAPWKCCHCNCIKKCWNSCCM